MSGFIFLGCRSAGGERLSWRRVAFISVLLPVRIYVLQGEVQIIAFPLCIKLGLNAGLKLLQTPSYEQ